jgi:cellobiose phosphorylase/cellobionic acid phosphorylase
MRKSYRRGSTAERSDLDRLVARAKRDLAQRKSPRAGFSKGEANALEARYSRFHDVRDGDGFLTESCLAVHRPDTPRPWLHLMASPHDEPYGVMGSFCDPTGSGFLCYESVLAGPVTSHKDTSYVPTAPRSTDVREFLLREDRAGRPAIWHMLPQVGCEPERYTGYSCCMHPGWMEIESTRRQIRSRLRIFVPVDDTCEVWTITLSNTSSRPRRLKLFTRVNWGLESHPSYYFDPRVTSLGDHLKDLRATVALNRHKANALPRTGFMMSSAAFRSLDLSGEEFTGGGHFREFPRAVEEGRCRNSLGLQPYLGLVGALQFDVNLAPGASRTVHVLVGRTEREPADYRKHLASVRRKYFTGAGVEREFKRSAKAWQEKLGHVTLRTPDDEIDRLYNVWLKYQQHNTARFTRALDQMGYRDVLQDTMGLCSFEPTFTRNMLPIALNYQLRDGRAIRQFFKYPNTNAPNDERMYGDSPVWIADTLVTYLEETGDFDILDEKVGFYDLATHRQDNRIKKSVYEHALLALQGLFNSRGQKGLCLIGHGDWNDAMDGLSKRGRGVSTWLSIALVYASKRLLKLAQHIGDRRTADLLHLIIETMTEAVNASTWDGDHYIFGFNDDGLALGANGNEEGRIHATVNAWALLSGVAAAAGRGFDCAQPSPTPSGVEGREEALLKGMRRLATPIGLALIDIPYTQRSRELAGRIADVTPGQFENGAVYTHAHAFYVYGLVSSGRAEEAYRQMKLALPGNTFPDITTGPPHQQSNFAVGPSHPNLGMNLYSNFTGATAWYLRTIDRMVGVMADFDGLRIAPAAPGEWHEYELRKRFRGADYHFRFRHESGRNRIGSVTVDGKALEAVDGEYKIPLPTKKPGRPVAVEVVM